MLFSSSETAGEVALLDVGVGVVVGEGDKKRR